MNKSRIIGMIILILLGCFVLTEKLVIKGEIDTQDLTHIFASPSFTQPLGSDHFGRSNSARLADALLNSIMIVIGSVVLSTMMGVCCGVLSGWRKGLTDRVFSTLANMIMALPGLVLVLLLGALVPGSFVMITVAIALTMWTDYFRVTRNKTQSLTSSPEFENATLYGFNYWYKFKNHIWPYIKEDIFVMACFGAGNAVLAVAALGFLYVGIKAPNAELGMMMVELFRYYSIAPWVLLQPIIALTLLIMSFHLLAARTTK